MAEPVNVFSNEYRSSNAVDEVASMLGKCSKSERKQILRSLNRVRKLSEKAQKKLDNSAYTEYKNAVETNFVHFFAALSLTMYEDYRWKEDDNHDQISSLLERLGKKIDKYANQGCDTDQLVKMVEDEIGIVLVPDTH